MDHLSPSPEGDVTVRATRAGVVFDVHVRAGDVVTPGTTLVDLGDPTPAVGHGLRAGERGDRRDAREPGRGGHGRDAGPDTIMATGGAHGRPWWIRSAAPWRCGWRSTACPRACGPGMFASVVLPIGRPRRRVVLPEAAVQRMADGDVVFLQETPGRFRAHPVTGAAAR